MRSIEILSLTRLIFSNPKVQEGQLSLSTSDSDRVIRNPNPNAGILPDPLTIASGTALRRKLLLVELPQFCSHVAKRIRAARASLFTEAAEVFISEGNTEGAAENYVRAILTNGETLQEENNMQLQELHNLLIMRSARRENK